MDPVSPACPRTPLKDTTNQVLSGGVIAKKPDVLNSSPTCSPILRDQESEAENLPYSHHSTPRKVQDCDGESDTTGDYESAGEASPWKEKQVNMSDLADTLAEVHLSTPNPSRALPVLDHFPFSPITGEDEEDEEVISITSNRSNNSIGGSLSLLKNSLNGDKLSSSPSHLISSPRSHENSENPHLESENVFKALTSLGQNLVDLPLSIGNDGKVISPAVEFEDAGPTCSFHSESTNDISSNNLSLCANSSAIEDCAALTSLPADGVINKNLNTSSGLTMEKNFETIPLNSPNKVEVVTNELPGLNVPNLPSPRSKINNLSPIKYLPESNQIKPEHPGLSEENHQNNISISESVLRLANEIHPACIETSPENISKLTSPVKLLSTENVLNEEVSPSSSLVENIKENDKMISQMCDLIETTFNNTLTENIGDLGLEGSPNKLLQSIKVDATDDASPPLIFKLSQFEDIEIKNEAVECCDKKEIIETEISPADSICNAEQEPLEKSSIQHISMTIPETDVKGEFSEKIISSSPMISAVSDNEISKPLPVNSNLSVDKEKTFDSIESIGTNQKLEKPAPCLENIISSVAFKSDEVTESILKEDSSLCSKDHFDDCKSVVDVSEECLPPIPNPESGLSDVPIETSLETTKLNGSIQLENVLPTTNDGKSSTSNESFKEHLTTEKPSQVTEENIMSSPLRNGSLLESSEIKSLPNEETDPSLTEITTADRMNANVHEILSNQQELSFPSEVTVVSNAQETGGIKDISKFSTDASAVSISPQPESSSDHVLEELVLSDSVSNDFKQEVNEICINENQNSIPENINAIVIENSMILPVESTDLSLTAAENKLKHESQKDETLHNLPTSNKELPTNTSQENSPNIITSVSVEDTAIACNLAGDSITSAEDPTCVGLVEIKQENSLTSVHCTFDIDGHHQTREVQGLFSTCPQNDTNKGGVKSVPELQNLPDVAKSTPKSGIDLRAKAGTPATPCNPILPIVDRTCTPLSYGTPTSTPNETDKNVTSKSLIGSYEDLLDKCSQQERSLGFDDSFKDEAEKVIEELNNTPPMPESDPASSTITSQATSEPLTNGISFETNDLAKGVADAFQDASTFDFEFLSKVTGKSNHRLARESLFLKFDPLVSAPSPTVQDNLEATSQPDILIAPAADQAASNSITPSSPRRSPTSEILVPLTPVTSTKSEEPYNSPVTSLGQTPRTRRRPSAGQVTPTLRQEVLSKEISRLQEIMVNQEMSYQDQIAEYKEEIEELRQQLDYLQRKHEGGTLEELYEEEKAKRIMIEQEFRIFVEELEIFLNHTTQKKEELEKTQEELRRIKVLRENEKMQNEAMISDLVKKVEVLEQHLSNNELAFNDVHQKYERSKKAIESFLLNETEYKKVLEEYKVDRAQQLEKYKGLKKEATEKLEQANQEIKEMRSAHKAEISKLEVINRRLQVQVKTLNDSLEQKSREVQELTKICDELINKVSKS